MTDGHALLRAIEANPDEDTPRLAYADWLEEHATADADRARAEFVRTQCALEREPPGARRTALAARERELLVVHGRAWVKQLPGQQFNDRFRRGFLAPVHLPAWDFCKHGDELAAVAPLHHVHLFKVRVGTHDLAECPTLGLVRHLDLRNNVMRNAHAAALAKSPHLVNVRTLTAAENSIGVAGCAALAGARLPALRHLLIWGNPLRDRGLAALRGAEWFPQLESLFIGHAGVSDAAVAALAADPNAAGLRALHVPDPSRGDAAARAILDSPHLTRLERLWFPSARPTRPVADALAARFGANLNPSFSLD